MSNSTEQDGERQQLLNRLSRSYEIHERTLRFGSTDFHFWALVDPNTLLDEVTLQASHAELPWQPYWGQLWDATHGLCEELMHLDLEDRTVLDLGCGLGIAGAVAASRGARVLLADNAIPALDFAKLNCWLWRDQTKVQFLDWNTDDLQQKFDLIVGADIVYDSTAIPGLSRFLRKHVACDSRILLSETYRVMTDDLIKLFRQDRWKIRERTCPPQLDRRKVRIFELFDCSVP
ncbi:MAG TPA: methyltransferase [Pirellulaceae bacterium]|nr:methyltransferase [Pirellulaceae bacterium]HMO91610.1 methyltransferase [Pirellulaceae bacterium]HMP68307.1 methyltransferase [Pirellulaceae bacterium]